MTIPPHLITMVEMYRAANGGKPWPYVILTLYGDKRDEFISFVADWFIEQGSKAYGLRFYREGYLHWLDGGDDCEASVDAWASVLWNNMPFNAPVDAEGNMFKMTRSNGKWEAWKPSDS